MAAAVEMAKGPHLRSIDCAETMTSKRRSRRRFELAGGSVFAAASELSDGVLSAAMAKAQCFASGKLARRGGVDEANKQAIGRVALSWP